MTTIANRSDVQNQRGHVIALLCVIVLGAVLRLSALGSNPPALFRDEAEKGYTAWSLARLGGYTALDPQTGAPSFHHLPLFIETPGALTSAIYQYAATPFVGLLGPTEFAIRLPAALAGILGVVVCYLLAFSLARDRRIALLAALFLAVSPWSVIFSRWAAQGIFVPLFTSAGLWLLWRDGDDDLTRLPLRWPLAVVCFSLAAYAYAPARLTTPLLVALAGLCSLPVIRRRPVTTAISGTLFFSVAVGLIVFQATTGAERFGRVSVFADATIVEAFGLAFINYVKHFSPVYLFVSGDAEWRHSIPGVGQMLWVEAPCFIAGLIMLIRRRRRADWLLLGWLLIGPIPAALTREAPHALRSIATLPAPSIISAIGLLTIWQSLGKRPDIRTITATFAAAFVVNVGALGYALFNTYAHDPGIATHWQYGLKQALALIHKQERENEPLIFVSGQIAWAPVLTLVYEQIDPAVFREQGISATEPIRYLSPAASSNDYYTRAPAGTWFVLKTLEGMPVKWTTAHVSYPGGSRLPPAICLFRK